MSRRGFSLAGWVIACSMVISSNVDAKPLRVLFLGDNGHHQPAARFTQLQPVLAARGIQVVYSDNVADLNRAHLEAFDGLMVYANIEKLLPEQEEALLSYVASGRGFIPVHCSSYCFLNSPKYVELVGAQFSRHGTGVFRTTIVQPNHPVVQGYQGFESWDETYVHHRHQNDRVVLEYRVEDQHREPWTWVRNHGKGRVFYTAWGHDERTWRNPGFHNLLERGIRWATGDDLVNVPSYTDRPPMTKPRADVAPFEFIPADVPFYPASATWGKLGDPIRQMQKPLPPLESLKHYVMPEGFSLELFAAEPELGGKPICMNWDERGRLWIAETYDYPNELQPPGQGRDRIRVCTDTDGDGRADQFKVFADKLSIPTSMIFARGGVIVHQAPHTLFLRDTNGDDVADERTELFTGWSTGDTHAGPSNLRYGVDNWLYGMVGYSGFEGTIGGERHSFRTGLYRFRADGSKMEFLRNTNNNSWGVGISEEGLLFGSTANGCPSVYMPIPNRYYEAVRGWSSTVLQNIAENARFYPITEKVRQVDHHGNFTAAAGHALYTARRYPPEYWNRAAFVAGPTGHLLATFQLQSQGADFHARYAWNLLGSDDEWSAPIMAEVGPDGNVWVIDWYNFIVQHNPTPAGYKTGKGNAYETDLRDKKHARIYRVVYQGRDQAKKDTKETGLTLHNATPEKLVATLKHDTMFWRLHAQRLLIEQNQRAVAPALLALLGDATTDAVGLNVGAIHAIWTLHGLGLVTAEHPEVVAALERALAHPSAGVRRNAVLALPRTSASVEAIIKSALLSDPDGQVQLASLLSLAEMPANVSAATSVATWLRGAARADRWLREAATCAAARHDRAFLEQVARDPTAPTPAMAAVMERVAEHHARSTAALAGPAPLPPGLDASGPMAAVILEGLTRGWPRGKTAQLDQAAEEKIVALLQRLPPAGRGKLVLLARRWGSTQLQRYSAEISKGFLAQARDERRSERERLDAARQLVDFQKQDDSAPKALLELITPRTPSNLATGLVEAVGKSEAPATGAKLLATLDSMTPAVRTQTIAVLLSRLEWTETLLTAVEANKVPFTELSLDQRQGLATHPNKKLASRARQLLARGGGLPNPDRQKVLAQLAPLAHKKGSAAAGKEVFKKQCAKCHTHSGEGAKIGPDLTGMAVHPKEELLTQVLDPSRSVEGNFRVYSVALSDGRVMTGLLASESRTAIEIYDAEGKRHAILREDIEQLIGSTKSLMPDGFEKQMKPEEIVDLLEFLTQRGKYLPLPLGKAATVVSTKGMFYSEEADLERLVLDNWNPRTVEKVPFVLIDPQGDRVRNVVMLHGPEGSIPPKMPKSVVIPCNAPARQLHLLSGVSGWGHPASARGSVSLIVRLHYADGKTEDHRLLNGEHFADYIRRVDVPQSKFAFALRRQQMRYLTVTPARTEVIKEIELRKGPDHTAPVVMAMTLESP